MADDSVDIQTQLDFNPCETPHGMKHFIFDDLTKEQRIKLNVLKRNKLREDQQYLAAHPEVRAIIALILRRLLRIRPRRNIHQFVGRFFSKPSTDIQSQINSYLEKRDKIVSTNSTIDLHEKLLAKLTDNKLDIDVQTDSYLIAQDIVESLLPPEEVLLKADNQKVETLFIKATVQSLEAQGDVAIKDENLTRESQIEPSTEQLPQSEEATIEEVVPDEEFCKEILEKVLEKVFLSEDDEILDIPSLPSIDFLPVEYNDTVMPDSFNEEDDDEDEDNNIKIN